MKKHLRKITFATVVVTTSVAGLLSGCGQTNSTGANTTATPKDGGTLTIGQYLPFDDQFLPDPPDNMVYTVNISNEAFDSLLSVNSKLQYIPWLAKSWSWSKDKKTLTMTLQPNATWSDGTPITSDDVLLAMDYLGSKVYNTSMQGQSGYLVSAVSGSDKLLNGKATSFAHTGGFHKISDKKFSITLQNVDAAVLWSDIAAIQPLPSHVLKAIPMAKWQDSAFYKKPTVVSGPFQFTAVHGRDSVEMAANDKYWKGKPHISKLIFKTESADVAPGLLANGSVDVQLNGLKPKDISKIKTLNGVSVVTTPDMGYFYVGMKLYKPEFKDVRVRQAFMYGINRQAMVQGILNGYGQVMNGPLPSVSWAFASGLNQYKYNVAKANALLDAAGWKKGADGWRIDPSTHKAANLDIIYPNDPNRTAVAVGVQSNLAKLGIHVKLESPLDVSTMYNRVEANDKTVDLWVGGWSVSADPDPRGVWGSTNPSNMQRWVDKKDDALIADTFNVKSFDQNYRKQALAKWQQYVNQQVPLIFVYQDDLVMAENNRVHVPQGDWTSVGPLNLQDWWLD